MSQEFRFENKNETRNYFLEEIEQNELISENYKKICATLNYIQHFLILASTITGVISISAFASLLGIPIGITSSAIGLKICAIAAGFKTYKSIIEKKKKKHDTIMLLEKSKLNSLEVLISKSLIDLIDYFNRFNKLPFINNIWDADLADMQLISKFDKGIGFLLCVIDIFGKYAWVIPLKDKKALQLLMSFKKFR